MIRSLAGRGAVHDHLQTLFRRGTANGLTEGELLARFVNGRDESAFEVLVARHGPMVLGICRQMLRDSNDVDDAFQATFLVLVRKAATLRRCDLLGNWLYGVAYRVAARARSQSAQRRARARSDQDPDGVARLAERPQAAAAQTKSLLDDGPLLHKELSSLPEKYRVPIVLCYFEGLTHDEAASRLGWPLGTVKGRLARARELLRRRLMSRGVTLSAAALSAQLAVFEAKGAVPASLQMITVRGALALAPKLGVSVAATSAASLSANALAQGVLRTMVVNQIKTVVLPMLLVTGTLVTGAGVAAARLSGGSADDKGDPVQAPAKVSAKSPSNSYAAQAPAGPTPKSGTSSIAPMFAEHLGAENALFSQLLARYADLKMEDIRRLFDWSQKTLEADEVLASTFADRVAAYVAHRDRMKVLFERTQVVVNSDPNQVAKTDLAQTILEQAEAGLKNMSNRQAELAETGMIGAMSKASATTAQPDQQPASTAAAKNQAKTKTATEAAQKPASSERREQRNRMLAMGGGSGLVGGVPNPVDYQLRSQIAVGAAQLSSRETNPQSKVILKKLDMIVSMPFSGNNTLEEVLKYIKQTTVGNNDQGIPIYVDPKGLQEADATLESPIQLDLEGVPLKTTFRLILKQLGLAYCVRDGVLIVSSVRGIAEELQEAQSELQAIDSPMGPFGGPGGMGGMGGMR